MKLFTALLLILPGGFLSAQDNYKQGDQVNNFQVEKILNHSVSSTSFNDLKKDLTIIDFFGTWCVPCTKALPKLSTLQEKYKDNVRIVLVSIEEEAKLAKFISTGKAFSLPLIVDDNKSITTVFNPPSYPFTVIINKAGTIIVLPEYDQLTDEAIQQWLKNTQAGNKYTSEQKKQMVPVPQNTSSDNLIVKLSQDFVYAVKTGEPTHAFTTQLTNLKLEQLINELNTDAEKMAFWINVYNGFTQVILKKDPDKYKKRNQFFGDKQITIAGHLLSLDKIEHGILRHSKVKWSLGYIGKLFPKEIEKQLRVDKTDARLHFTLNCGAKSCPPIAFYRSENIIQQLQVAAKAYLSAEAEYDSAKGLLKLPAIMGWFRGDFGGKKGMRKLMKELELIPAEASPRIKFKKYNWDLYLNNYKK
jgi:thiol-disulfide isomerase/thioredoxin